MPPSMKRQQPPKKEVSNPQFEAGSLLADAVPVSSLIEDKVKICVYGRNRTGKTTFACQFPKPILLVSTEPDACGGAGSVTNIDGVMLQRVSYSRLGRDARGMWVEASNPTCVHRDSLKGSEKLRAIAAELANTNGIGTVVLDTATSLQDIILGEIMGWSKLPEVMPNAKAIGKENFFLRSDRWRDDIRSLLNVYNCHVVILAKEKDHNPSSDDFGGKSKIRGTLQSGSFMAPAIGSTNADWLQDACGYVFQLYEDEVMQDVVIPMINNDGVEEPLIQKVGTGKRQRHLRLKYDPNYAAGGRIPFDPSVPDCVTAPTPAELYAAMAKYIPSLRK